MTEVQGDPPSCSSRNPPTKDEVQSKCEPFPNTANVSSTPLRAHSDAQQAPTPEGSTSDGAGPGQKQLEKSDSTERAALRPSDPSPYHYRKKVPYVHDRRPGSHQAWQTGYHRNNPRYSGYRKEDGGYSRHKPEHGRKHFEPRWERRDKDSPGGGPQGEPEGSVADHGDNPEVKKDSEVEGSQLNGSGSSGGRGRPPYDRRFRSTAGYGRYHERQRQSKAATRGDKENSLSGNTKGKGSKSVDDRVCKEGAALSEGETRKEDEGKSRVSSDEGSLREKEKDDRSDKSREYQSKKTPNEMAGRTPRRDHEKRPLFSKERSYRGEREWRERERDRIERERDWREGGRGGSSEKQGVKLMRRTEEETGNRKMPESSGTAETAVRGKGDIKNVAERTGDSKDTEQNEDRRREPERTDGREKEHSAKTSSRAEQQRKPHDLKGKTESNRKKPPSSQIATTRSQTSVSKPRGKKVIPTVQSDELAQQLTAGTYECMVCCDRVEARDYIWSCAGCYHVFHLQCIKKWAKSPAAGVVAEQDSSPEGWQCPGCRRLSTVIPSVYKCYCGKVNYPRPKSQGELTVPHSCGELCLKKLAVTPESSCKHRCRLPCHPGPCPPCPVMVTRSCPCGAKVYHVRCSKIAELPSCGAVCRRKLGCGKHYCGERCHSGPCPICSVLLTQSCHCGRSSREVRCGEVTETAYSCGHTCERELDCGNHLCEQVCHEGLCLSCSLLPSHVTTCPCGATPLSELLPGGTSRISCLDPIPTCSKTCGRLLPCSTPDDAHHCPAPCHEGECPPCDRSTSVQCQCGRASVRVVCVEVERMANYQCQHVCNKKKSCGRHRCHVRCCTDTGHSCDLKCGKRLQCGLHCCQEKCHSGHCGQCWEYSYEELMCHCGAEVIYPPIPCGTRPPSCSRLCARMHPCLHPVNHTCHSEEECPPCTFLTEKMCMGGHELRRNIPCHISDVSCGNACGKPLPCGMHKCQRICHKGVCLEQAKDCKQPCTTTRKFCSHACAHPCHVGEPCPDTPCKAVVSLSCSCKRRSERVPCMASGSGAMHQVFQKLLSKDLGAKIRGLQSGQSINISSITVSSASGERYLECDELCAQEARNRRLASALEINNPVISPLVGAEGHHTYSLFLLQEARSDFQFVASVEDALKGLVEAALKSSSAPTRSHSFRPMKSDQRRVIHELAVHYGCDTISYDPEPQRNVMITANKSRARLPPLSLTKLVERERYKPPPAPVSVMAVSEKKDPTKIGDVTATDEGTEKVPDYFADDFSV